MAIETIQYKNWRIPIEYQDRDLIIVNKPAGLLTVPIPKSKAHNLTDALTGVLRHQTKEIQPVHRIDRYTSGLVVFSKNSQASEVLIQMFKNHEPERVYRALVWGVPKENDHLVHHLKRVTKSFKNVTTSPNDPGGTRASMEYRTLATYRDGAILEIKLHTGLKNQIRAQLSSVHLPIVGERQYDTPEKHPFEVDRQMLHAYRISLTSPTTGEAITVQSDAPKDFSKALSELKKRS